MNASVAAVMAQVGRAISNTFDRSVGAVQSNVSGPCVAGFATVRAAGSGTLDFDFIMSREDLVGGQRIANYSVEYERVGRPGSWEMLVQVGGDCGPHPGQPPCPKLTASLRRPEGRLGDPVAGYFARDQHVGTRRIDVPQNTSSWHKHKDEVSAVRFSCAGAYAEPVSLASFSLHKKCADWEGGCGLGNRGTI